jgi:hypothetical protein
MILCETDNEAAFLVKPPCGLKPSPEKEIRQRDQRHAIRKKPLVTDQAAAAKRPALMSVTP